MKFSKQRLESMTDGVIAIIITIMVLSIPLPESFLLSDILEFMRSILIYLLSFIVVGAFWVQHHRLLSYADQVPHKLILSNFMFLFFLSLIPVLTKWVIDNPGVLIPAIGYDIIYIIVNLCYVSIFHYVMKDCEHEDIITIKRIRNKMQATHSKEIGRRFAMLIVVAALAVAAVVLFTKISTVLLLGIPVLASLFNLLSEDFNRKRNKNGNRRGIKSSNI